MNIIVEDLECTAIRQRDHTAEIRIRGSHWLTVRYDPNANRFQYKWERAQLTREGAAILLGEVDSKPINRV